MPDRIAPNGLSGRLRTFRTDKGLNAWLICSTGAAFVGSAFFTIGMATHAGALSIVELILVTLARLVLGFFFTSILILIATGIVAPPITWLAARLRLEHPLFYFGFGTACGLVAGWTLSGDTAAFPFERMTLLSAPIFGGTWGLLWWLVYRRPIGKGSVSDVSGIFE